MGNSKTRYCKCRRCSVLLPLCHSKVRRHYGGAPPQHWQRQLWSCNKIHLVPIPRFCVLLLSFRGFQPVIVLAANIKSLWLWVKSKQENRQFVLRDDLIAHFGVWLPLLMCVWLSASLSSEGCLQEQPSVVFPLLFQGRDDYYFCEIMFFPIEFKEIG